MNDPNRVLKWLLVIGLVVLSLVLLYPPDEKLKGGIDLVGGTSLLFEIDTTGLSQEDRSGLASKVMRILKDRVDPQGQMNLEWRPVGNTRLEIRMPRPPKQAIARRDAYDAAIRRLQEMNVSRFELEAALNAPAQEREPQVMKLAQGMPERETALRELLTAHQAYVDAQGGGDTAAVEGAAAGFESAMSKVLATNLPIARFTDILALEDKVKRDAEIEKLRADHPSYDGKPGGPTEDKALTLAVRAHDLWAVNKADLEDPSDLKRRIRGAGVLEFRILAERNPSSPGNTMAPEQPIARFVEQLQQQGPRPKSGDRYRWFPVDNLLRFTHLESMERYQEIKDQLPAIIEEYAGRHYVLVHNDPDSGLLQSGAAGRRWALRSARPDVNPMTGENVVSFSLDPRGGQLFGELTGNNVGRQLCIMLDNTAISHATINERITEHCQISGRFNQERVQDLVRTLEAGSLPARLKETPLSEQTIGPSLGESNRTRGTRAAIWGGALVALFMLFYYGLVAGGVANIALMLNLVITLALMALMQATFTLPGIAGLILTVGMAVDANVLIFERIREERARGVIFKKALNAGYDRAFSAIFDGNLTTLITCVILGFVGSEEVKGFAITLGLGLVTSMFTALTVTRLIFNTLIAKGWLTGLSMRKVIGIPNVDWVGLRRIFWPVSTVVVLGGLTLFLTRSLTNTESLYDIEFLGGTGVQVDLKPEVAMSDEDVREAITSTTPRPRPSAVQWLNAAADQLKSARIEPGATPGQFRMTSDTLSGDQMAVLMRPVLEQHVDARDGIEATGRTATFHGRPGQLDEESLNRAVAEAAGAAQKAANLMRSARVQSIAAADEEATDTGKSYEIVTIETNRPLVQASVMAAMGDKLNVQQPVKYTAERDEELTRESFFVIETEDQYLSDVLGDESALFDIRRYRGGVAIKVVLDETEPPMTVEAIDKRLREVGLQSDFDHQHSREMSVLPLGQAEGAEGTARGFHSFAVVAVDEALLYEDNPALWTDEVAKATLAQVDAALGSEKTLSKVLQFAPQIAGQTRNKALFAIVLSLLAIGAYVWLRFGNKEFGLATIVTLVHDVAVTLGAIAISHVLYNSFIGRGLMIDDFRVDLPMVAALLTIIGYSLNDTIVVFDRIRENRGKSGTLNKQMINTSINQTLSRTILTSFTVFLVVFVLYIFGGAGIHGFSYALLIGVLSGSYSTLAIAVPLVYRPRVLRVVAVVLAVLILAGIIFAEVHSNAWRAGLIGAAVVAGWQLLRRNRDDAREVPEGVTAGV